MDFPPWAEVAAFFHQAVLTHVLLTDVKSWALSDRTALGDGHVHWERLGERRPSSRVGAGQGQAADGLSTALLEAGVSGLLFPRAPAKPISSAVSYSEPSTGLATA